MEMYPFHATSKSIFQYFQEENVPEPLSSVDVIQYPPVMFYKFIFSAENWGGIVMNSTAFSKNKYAHKSLGSSNFRRPGIL